MEVNSVRIARIIQTPVLSHCTKIKKKRGFFPVRDGELQQYSSEEDDMPKSTYQIRNCGGCVRATAESKPFALSVSLNRRVCLYWRCNFLHL